MYGIILPRLAVSLRLLMKLIVILPPGWFRIAGVLMLASAILLRSMIVPGYMPSSLATGYPVMLCPQGLDSGWYEQISAPSAMGVHAHHHHHANHDHRTDGTQTDHAPPSPGVGADHPLDRCALGSGFSILALLSSLSIFEVSYHSSSAGFAESELIAPIRTSPFHARAPPRLIPV